MHGGGVSCDTLGLHLLSCRELGRLPVRVLGLQWGVGREGVGRNSGSWHQQTQIPVGQKQMKSAGHPQQLCWPLVSVVKVSGVVRIIRDWELVTSSGGWY